MSKGVFSAGPCVCAALLALALAGAPIEAASETDLYRLFLMDGTTLVSYGEFARVADRVVFSIPIGSADRPELQLVSISQSSVDWERTDRYANAVRAKRYGETRGESDFALLGGRVTEALNQIALTPDLKRRLAMAEEARRNLTQWPAQNFGYRAADIEQLAGILDEVIGELRVAAGESGFEISLVANTLPPAAVELLPPPDLRGTLEQAFQASRLTPEPVERVSLLRSIATALKGPAQRGDWAAALNARVAADLSAELRIGKAYSDLVSSTIGAATARAARGDVSGVEGLVHNVLSVDDRLGRKRPQETAALLALLDLKLDAARRLRLARDAWALRVEAFATYRRALTPALEEFERSKRALEMIRQLAGPAPIMLPRLEQRIILANKSVALITPPAELQAAHALYSSAFQMAQRAASTRRTAILSQDMSLAWDAASAAAGALMLIERAAEELDRLTTPPSNR